MNPRCTTRPVYLGTLQIGGQNHVVVQSMCSIKTSKVSEVSDQINRCAALGAEAMRLSCLDEEDARAFAEIKKRVNIPLIADIHFDYRLAIIAMESGVDAIRIIDGIVVCFLILNSCLHPCNTVFKLSNFIGWEASTCSWTRFTSIRIGVGRLRRFMIITLI